MEFIRKHVRKNTPKNNIDIIIIHSFIHLFLLASTNNNKSYIIGLSIAKNNPIINGNLFNYH